jgi:hypothetical protein
MRYTWKQMPRCKNVAKKPAASVQSNRGSRLDVVAINFRKRRSGLAA